MSGTDPIPVSRTQVQKAGSRIREAARQKRPPADGVLRAIDEFRGWHLPTVTRVQNELSVLFHEEVAIEAESLPITSRLKTLPAIVAKLQRSETSLLRMQDLAGARIVVPGLVVQDAAFRLVCEFAFRGCVQGVKDQREEPDQYGYRAIHAIVRLDERLAEIQIRTRMQDRWAQLVERLDSGLGTDLKHGRGPSEWLEWLHGVSDEFRKADLGEPFEVPPIPHDEREDDEESAWNETE